MLRTLVLIIAMGTSFLCSAEVKVFQPTDNTGINKYDQINGIEKYLATLSTQLNSLEQKIDANAGKIKNLESAFVVLRDNDLKKIQDQLAPKANSETTVAQKAETNTEEVEKLKADFLAIKNNDVEQMRLDINSLRFAVKNLESILKVSGK